MRAPAQEDDRPIRAKTVRRVIGTFKPYRRKVAWVGLAIVVTSGLGVVNPLLIKWIFDTGLFGDPPGTCGGLPCPQLGTVYVGVALMIAIPIVTGVIGVGQTYLANWVGLRVMQDLRNSLYSHLQFMPLRFFTTTRTGEIQSRIANDVGGVQAVFTDTVSNILSNIVVIVSTLFAMLLLSWQLTVLSLFMMPFFLWLTVKVGRARREVATSTAKTYADLTAVTEETLSVSGILLSKSFGRQRHEIGRFQDENERLTGLQMRQTMIGRSFFAIVGTFFSITPALVYLVAAWVMSANPTSSTITAGTIVAFTTLQSRLFFPIGSMLQVSTEIHSSMALFDRTSTPRSRTRRMRSRPRPTTCSGGSSWTGSGSVTRPRTASARARSPRATSSSRTRRPGSGRSRTSRSRSSRVSSRPSSVPRAPARRR
jgi:ATP-binding cassette subfamily B protein